MSPSDETTDGAMMLPLSELPTMPPVRDGFERRSLHMIKLVVDEHNPTLEFNVMRVREPANFLSCSFAEEQVEQSSLFVRGQQQKSRSRICPILIFEEDPTAPEYHMRLKLLPANVVADMPLGSRSLGIFMHPSGIPFAVYSLNVDVSKLVDPDEPRPLPAPVDHINGLELVP